MRSYILFLFICFQVPQFLWAQELFSPMDKMLSQYVKNNNISGGGLETSFDYVAAKNDKNVTGLIQQQTQNFQNFDTKTLKTKNQATAFWINAYNFFMIKKILKDGFKKGKLKIDGVKSFGSFFDPYKVFKKEEFNIGGKLYSLDKIEKGILLGDDYKKKGWKDARIHFAANCASVGCPPLLTKAYNEKTIDKTLSENVQMALKTPRHMSFSGGKLRLTHLFKWYKKDFKEQAGTVKDFLKKYTDEKFHTKIDQAKAIEYIDYDWNLNKPSNFSKKIP